jgi:hypothetical protein
MGVVRADDLEPRAARAPERGEVIGRFDLELGRAPADVPRAHDVLDEVGGPDEEPAALVRQVFPRMGDDAVEGVLTNLHALSIMIEVPL